MIRGDDITRFWSKTKIGPGGCVLFTARTRDGYGKFMTGPHGAQTTHRAHRWIYERAVAPLGERLLRHSCDTPNCVALQHLEPGTQKQNREEAAARGRTARGEKHPRARLSPADVIEIRRLRASGSTRRDIAERFSVTPGCIDAIVARRNWRHV